MGWFSDFMGFSRPAPAVEKRYSFLDYQNDLAGFLYNGLQYLTPQTTYGLTGGENIGNNFEAYVAGAYRANGPVFACVLARALLFSEARFQFRQLRRGRPGDLFGTEALGLLEKPWPNGTTGELLWRMEQDASLAGNFYATTVRGQLRRLRPDWTTIVLGSTETQNAEEWDDVNSHLAGYVYQRPGTNSKPEFFLPDMVAHYSPIPDPVARYRGMSWLTPVIREIEGDQGATTHKKKFFDNAATPNLAVSLNKDISPEAFERFVEMFDQKHKGALNAYKTLFLGGGADVKVVGSNFHEMSFKATQGAGETRICAAAGVPPIIVGLSEGLEASTYSNYGQARRKFGDHWARPHWRMASAALSTLVNVPSGSELWYDHRDIAFLAEDQKDAAEIREFDARTTKALVEAGFTPETVVDAVTADDFSRLEHSGLVSVQLQPPGTQASSEGDVPQEGQEDDDDSLDDE